MAVVGRARVYRLVGSGLGRYSEQVKNIGSPTGQCSWVMI
jgi:hypothetical protein